MKEAGIAGDVGAATGYILRFSNGLVAYLSGDTGIIADQELVVRDYYHAKLAVMNIGDGFTTGPDEAAYVINELVKPASVIASHANEVGTVGGKVRARQQDRDLHEGGQGAGAYSPVGQDDGVRRRGPLHRRVLRRGSGATRRRDNRLAPTRWRSPRRGAGLATVAGSPIGCAASRFAITEDFAMPVVSMRQLLDHAAENGYGIPAFNVNNLEQVQAVMSAAAEVGAPVILQA